MKTNTTIDEKLLEVREHKDAGYLPLVDFETWRVAVLNFAEELRPEELTRMQRHNETDEVFVLLRGRAILFVGEGDELITEIHGQPLEPHRIYNVKQRVWHHHTLSEDAMVLVVENRDTTFDNSPFCELTSSQRQKILSLTRELWDNGSAAPQN